MLILCLEGHPLWYRSVSFPSQNRAPEPAVCCDTAIRSYALRCSVRFHRCDSHTCTVKMRQKPQHKVSTSAPFPETPVIQEQDTTAMPESRWRGFWVKVKPNENGELGSAFVINARVSVAALNGRWWLRYPRFPFAETSSDFGLYDVYPHIPPWCSGLSFHRNSTHFRNT